MFDKLVVGILSFDFRLSDRNRADREKNQRNRCEWSYNHVSLIELMLSAIPSAIFLHCDPHQDNKTPVSARLNGDKTSFPIPPNSMPYADYTPTRPECGPRSDRHWAGKIWTLLADRRHLAPGGASKTVRSNEECVTIRDLDDPVGASIEP